MRVVSVAVPVPALEALTYTVPDNVPDPPPGARVLVPLGGRIVTGCVLGPAEPPPDGGRLKAILDVLDDDAFLPAEIVRLAAWVAEYYACGVGEAVGAAMPPRALIESERYARITDAGASRAGFERGLRRDILERLASGEPVKVGTLAAKARGVQAALATLERDGLATLTQPLKGQASAYRTTRTAVLTAQGLDVASREADDPAPVRLGERQREALDLLRGAPEGLDVSDLRADGIGSPDPGPAGGSRPRLLLPPPRRARPVRGDAPAHARAGAGGVDRRAVRRARAAGDARSHGPLRDGCSCTASPAAARPRSICGWRGSSTRRGAACCCWCRRLR